ncbi:MAG: amino acid permease [Thermoleophilia bacterium]|nr:amino acid permease [Thermoleophilia bacterium]
MATRRDPEPKQDVRQSRLAAVLFVNLAMAVFVSLGVVADRAVGLTPAIFIVAGVVFLLILIAYIEGIMMLPQAGGAAGFARRGLGEMTSFFAGWALMLDYLILVVLTAYVGVHYFASIPGLDWLLHSPADAIGAGVFIAVVGIMSLRRLKPSARVSATIAIIALLTLIALAVVGLFRVFEWGTITETVDVGLSPSWHDILYSLPVAMIGFTGIDSVANLGGEMHRAGRTVPRPLIWSGVVSVGIFVLLSMVALNAQPVTGMGASASTPLGEQAGWIDRPVIGIVDGLGFGSGTEQAARTVVSLLAAAVLFLAASSALAALGRVAYFMSRHRQAPSALLQLDRRTGAPKRAIFGLTILALLLLAVTASVSDSAVVLAQVYAFGATLTATLAGVGLVRMRFTEPDLERPFRAPLNVRIRGRSVSVLMVLGTMAALGMWLLVLATHDSARVVGLGWMTVGFVLYGTYRLTHGLPLARRATERVYKAPRIDARSYEKVPVAVRPEAGKLYGAGDAEVIALARKLLDDRQAGAPSPEIGVMLVHELPLTEALDARLGEADAAIARRLTRIRDVASKLDLRVSSTVSRARAAGRAICQEAELQGSDAVLLATRTKRRTGDEVFGKCVAYVLRHAPCDVVVLALPEASFRKVPKPPSPPPVSPAFLQPPPGSGP